ncbi:MAG: DUF4175 domain-containing protein [Rubellimicrobium sp.]|nr:DUF4175 domain-containing protein [Rubellimicrobium sp.]
MAERAWQAFWPAVAALMAVSAPVLAGLDRHLTPALRLAWIIGAAALVLVLAVIGWRRLRWPDRTDALARIDARLAGRPLAALADRQATGAGDAASVALWAAHRARMTAAARAARPVPPDLDLARRDPFGLRLMALLVFATALLFAPPRAVPGAGGTPSRPGQTPAHGPAWEGWVEPPAYTGRPVLYLADLPEGALELLSGTRVTIRRYGDGVALEESVSQDGGGDSFTVARDGRIAVGDARWQVSVRPDLPPVVMLTDPPEVEATGRMTQPFHAGDDYGVTAGSATITLDLPQVARSFGLAADPDPRAPLAVDLPMPFSGERTDFDERLIEDFSQHAWANLPVRMVLHVEDALGQRGDSAAVGMVLPGRRFFQPVARAVIEQRRDLLWSHANAPRVLDLLRAIANRPDDIFRTRASLAGLRAAIDLLAAAVAADDLAAQEETIAGALWAVALDLEEGALADALARLERAQERLQQAMRDGASSEEIADLMRELREATDDWLDLLAQQAEPAPDQTDTPQGAQDDRQQVTEDEIQQLMDRIQELMEQGRMDEAQALMQQLDELLRNLQMQQAEGQGSGRPRPGGQQMQDLQDTMRGQQDLSDDAFRELQDRFNGRGDNAGDDAATGADQDSLAERQQQLRRDLERLQSALPGLTSEAAGRAREALDAAGDAMDRAGEALAQDDLPGAIDSQSEALEALREGMEQLRRALAENDRRNDGQGGYERAETGRPVPERRDPLGRQSGTTGREGSEAPLRSGPDVAQRAQELLDELRRRAGERTREAEELDYLGRLIERF